MTKIVYSPTAIAKIKNWVDICPQEISGLGIVSAKGGTIYVEDALLLTQECSPAETELDREAIAELQFSLDKNNRDKLRLWWHSHVNMGVFWSGTDEANIRSLRGDKFFLHSVFNKREEHRTRLEVCEDFCNESYDKLPFSIDTSDEALDPYMKDIYRTHLGGSVDLPKSRRELRDLGVAMAEDVAWLAGDPIDYVRNYHFEFCKKEYEEKVSLYIPPKPKKGGKVGRTKANPHIERRRKLLGLDEPEMVPWDEYQLINPEHYAAYMDMEEMEWTDDSIDNLDLFE